MKFIGKRSLQKTIVAGKFRMLFVHHYVGYYLRYVNTLSHCKADDCVCDWT